MYLLMYTKCVAGSVSGKNHWNEKKAEAKVLKDVQTSVELCRSASGAGNETRIWHPTH